MGRGEGHRPAGNPVSDKAALRAAMRKRRSALSSGDVSALSQAAQRHILNDNVWRQAASAGLYIAVRHEVQTDLLIRSAWSAGKTVLAPYIPDPAAGEMYLMPYADGSDMRSNAFGIPEPVPAVCPQSAMTEAAPAVLIVPGLAFDMQGRRIGSGGGYYDRLLARPHMQNVPRIGLAYAFQVSAAPLPAEPWDVPVNAIATEEGLTWL